MKHDEAKVSNGTEKISSVESLNMLRFLHQSIMLASAAVLILGLTPDPSYDYNAALDELIALRSVEPLLQEYPSYLQHRLQPAPSDTDRSFLDLAMQTGTRMAEHVVTPQPFACDCGVSGVRLRDYYVFFSGTHKIAPLELNYDKTRMNSAGEFLKRQIAIQQPVHAGLQFEGIEPLAGGMGRSQGGTLSLDWRNLPPSHKLDGYAQFIFTNPASITDPRLVVPIAVTYSLGAVQEGHFALDWLRSTPMGAQLTDPQSDDVFPKLRKLGFWRSISVENDVDTAISNLQKKLDSINTETTSFFGISVNKAIALWAGPFVCFAIEWFFLRHLGQVSVLASSREMMKDYPWVAMFPGWWNGLTTYISLVVLPAVANLLLLVFYGHRRNLNTWFGIGFTVLTIVVGVMTFRQMRCFRSDLYFIHIEAVRTITDNLET
jgi:hypothetical protein